MTTPAADDANMANTTDPADEADGANPVEHGTPGIGLWIGLVLGSPFVWFGFFSEPDGGRYNRSIEMVQWVVGAAIVHDALIAPFWIAGAILTARLVPTRIRFHVRAALVGTVVVIAYALPLVRGYGLRPDNPTALPRDYTAGLLISLALVWGLAALWAVVSLRRPAIGVASHNLGDPPPSAIDLARENSVRGDDAVEEQQSP